MIVHRDLFVYECHVVSRRTKGLSLDRCLQSPVWGDDVPVLLFMPSAAHLAFCRPPTGGAVRCCRMRREIAERSGMHVSSIKKWIAHSNAHGLASFDDPPNPDGRPSILTSEQLGDMVKIALSRLAGLTLPYTHWSVEKLRQYLMQRDLFQDFLSEWIRRLPRREGMTLQRIKTWKESPTRSSRE